VIFYSLERCRSVADFVWLRISRLYPAYWSAVLLAAVIAPLVAGEHVWVGGTLSNLTMFQEFFGYPHIDAVYWSLTVELAFYCNVAWVFFLGWHRRPETVSFVWLCLAGIWAFTFFNYSPGNALRSGLGALLLSLDYAAYFVIGLTSFAASRRGWSGQRVALILSAIALEWTLFRVEGAITACAAALLLITATRGYLSVLVSRLTLWLGAISYSLYLTHRNFGFSFSKWLLQYLQNGWAVLGITIIAALLLATILTYSVERPMAGILRRKWASRPER
jgi:peptidoglycan/LPS O-acetylase OafA/YrhL